MLISKDEDFVHISSTDPDPSPVVWIRVGNCTKRALLDWFAPLFPSVIKALNNGETLIEVI